MGLQDIPTVRRPGTGQAPDTALHTPHVPGASTDHSDLSQELIRVTIMATPLQAQASDIDEIHREDESSGHNGSGYERDETDTSFYQLVRHLVGDGDDRARTAGRRARRTLAEMDPEYVRQPVLVLHRPSMNDACPVCTRWNCDGTNCPPSVAPAPASAASARTAVAR